METVYSLENDTVDLLVFRYFNKTAGIVEKVLEANNHVLDFEILPIGTEIKLPKNLNELTQQKTIALW